MSEIQVEDLTPDKVGKVRNGITMIIVWLIKPTGHDRPMVPIRSQ